MLKFATISSLLSLTLCAGCTTTKPAVIVQTVTVKERIPAALIRPCPPKWHKAGGPTVTEDWITRGDQNEAALDTCSDQVDGIRQWDAESK